MATEPSKLYDLASKALADARSIIDEWEAKGEAIPADVDAVVNKHLGDVETFKKMAEQKGRMGELDAMFNKVDESKRLPILQPNGDVKEMEVTDEIKAFNAFLRGNHLSGAERKSLKPYIATKAALAEGTDSTGGYLTPNLYWNEIVKPLTNASYLRAAGARVITMESDSLEVPTLINSSVAILTTEAAAYNEVEPTFGAVTFKPYKYSRKVLASEETVADSRFDLMSQILAPDFAQAFAAAENAAFTLGTGSSQPEGVVTNCTVGVTLATGQTLTITSADSVYDTYYALDYKYRGNATWMANDATIQILRKLKDSQNRYILSDNNNLMGGAPNETILGRPVKVNNSMDAPGVSKKTLLLGDLSYFWIADRAGMGITVLRELHAETGQVGFVGMKRFDSHPMLAAAFTCLKQSAS